MRYLVSVVCVLWLISPSMVFADAVPMPPDDDECPNGGRGETSHCGPHCIAWSCTGNHQCDGGRVCIEQSLCIEEVECMSGYGTFIADFLRGNCTDGSSCRQGSCMRGQRVCAFAPVADADVPDPQDSAVDAPADAPVDSSTDAPVDSSTDAPVDSSTDAPADSQSDGGENSTTTWGCGCRAGRSASGLAPLALGLGLLGLFGGVLRRSRS